MDSYSEMDETVNLDESEWVPSENYSDDDSIEIVGELMEAKLPVRCSTRATRKPSKPTSVRSLVLIDSDDEDELPSLDPPQIQQKIAPRSPKPKSTQAREDSKGMAQKRITPVSAKISVADIATRPSLARYTTHGPPLGVDLSTLPEEGANGFQGTKRKQPGEAQPFQKKFKRSKTPAQTEDFVRLSENVPSAKRRKICSLSNLKNDVRGTVNNNSSSAKSIPTSRLGSHSQLSTLKTNNNPTSNKSVSVKKEIDSNVVRESVVMGSPRVKKEVIDYEQQPALPSLSRVKRENFDPACPQNGSVFGTPPEKSRVKLEASTMSLDCSTSSEFSPVKKKCPPTAPKAVKKSTITSKKVKASQGDISYNWDAAHVISLRQGIDRTQAKEIIKLVDQECTLPFIARYRREQTGNLDVNKLREVLNSYEQLKEVKEKVSKLVKEKKTLALETRESLLKATSLQEVKTLTASLRSSGNKTYADRARKLGLGEATEALLKDPSAAPTRDWAYGLVVSGKEGRKSVEEVETGVKFILADIISKNPKLTEHMRTWLKRQDVVLKSCTSRKAASQVKVSSPKSKKVIAKRKSMGGKAISAKTKKLTPSTAANIGKYEKYFNFAMNAWRVHSHSVCAINRGEQQGVLTVKVLLPSFAYREFEAYVAELWLGRAHSGGGGHQHVSYRHHLIQDTLSDCWERLVSPSLQSWVRSQLSETAELASIEVFVTNLRHLLLTPPVRANTVLAIDPGFHKGCKIAVVERKGKVLAVETIHPFTGSQAPFAAETLSRLVCEYRCEIIAIGNGTACRETEAWLSQLIRTGAFPGVNVQYTIVNESGASHYSVTDEARAEFPSMDVNHISAVSLARRLQDPLLEYVKVPPMHLGVGMYQHDVSNKLLTTALDSVVMECVSFVGVDLNVASEVMLRKVSGLTKARATAIVKYRDEVGPFRDREQLKKVKGIGPVSFQQCAGFVKVVPQTLRQRSNNSNLLPLCPLDSTTVHPESYTYAKKLIGLASLDIENVGSSQFIEGLKSFVKRQPIQELSEKCGCSSNTLDTILESLYQPLDFDYRAQFKSPLFRKGVTSISELKLGQHLTGSVMNVTTFGAFVDIGVGNDGLIHKSRMGGHNVHVGNTVEVKVANLDVMHRKVGLELVSLVK